MCGLLGCVVTEKKPNEVVDGALGMIAHRGPDHRSYHHEKINGKNVYLGHTRLSVIDLSDQACQPFNSICGRYCLVYNGEVYNYREIRSELKNLGYSFRTESDTEVLLYSIVQWGVEVLRRLIGMFSFVFLDRAEQKLIFIRDAFGIKPFFYAHQGNNLYFASEMQPLIHLRQEAPKPDLQRAYDYLVHGYYDSSEFSFVAGVNQLPPAHYFNFNLKTGELSEPKRWWKPEISNSSSLSFDQAAEKLRNLFLDSVALHLRSDVPVGVALSGGIDSSAVVSAVRHLEPDVPLNTFSYVSNDQSISEEKWIDLLNKEMGTREHKVIADEQELEADLDDMLLKQGEPFGSTSIYAQYRVYRLAKESGVTVTLDGQGADELLAGYSGYPGHRLLSLIETKGWRAAHQYAKRWAQSPSRNYFLAWQYLLKIKLPNRLYSLARKKMGRDFEPAWLNTEYMAENGVVFMEARALLSQKNQGLRVKEALAHALMHHGLPSLLRHGDRNSMAFSIESRVPFLTIPLAEFLLSLPESYLVSEEGVTKHVFREAMRGIVPDSHLDRKDKIGFATPESTWLLSMADLVKSWIDQAPDLPFLNKEKLVDELEEVVDGKRNFDGRVWRWVNYLRWCSLMGVK
ncbi:asparagine synthase (glutamine-hydrolyzing) [Billgrantia gudaonensis]|uniref:asparagine synthase (glutamine-hydrolyzing) n=1 Tax=Billgrantia gudaonensis TaxID=376427 RepID=A0A1G8QYH8_9GAMM|nr:asparagine synthase (glutamine-hydrolyzing) [Halomonas gudaonensis]SDJ09784.1 asparagine synthase (glutamine-hydrolysing) [Halomonas gudaonensis]